jgi:SAM-dependent methyltransferase
MIIRPQLDQDVVGCGLPTRLAATSDDAATRIAALEHAAWGVAALVHLCNTTDLAANVSLSIDDEGLRPARVLATLGLLTEGPEGFALAPGLAALLATVPASTRAGASTSTLRQIATLTGIVPKAADGGWATFDDETLLVQGNASALAGRMFATVAVGSLPGLADRFRDGGRFLDVGTGVGALGAAFAETLPNAAVVGLDVLERAVDLARNLVDERGLGDRFEIRRQGVEDLDDIESFDLAWIPAPFIPETVFDRALANIHRSLKPGGWIIVGAGRLDGDDTGVAVTRWQTALAGGTPLTTDDTRTRLTDASFTQVATIPIPPGAPVLTCAQRPQ